MSTLKSSAEDLTLNADGSGNDIKFQSNAVEKASLSDAGLLTTSGGASLDGAVTINESGADVDFRVEASGAAHALYLDGSNGRIGKASDNPHAQLHIVDSTNDFTSGILLSAAGGSSEASSIWHENVGNTSLVLSNMYDNAAGQIKFNLREDGTAVTALTIVADGRGLSQFTAKAWANLNGTGTIALRDSHNISSVTDNGTGDYTVAFSNDMANGNYSLVMSAGGTAGVPTTKCPKSSASLATGSFQVEILNAATGTVFDSAYVFATVFGD